MYVACIYDEAEILSPMNKAILGVGEGSMELAPPEAISCMDGWMAGCFLLKKKVAIMISEILGGENGRFGVNGIERATSGALGLQGFNSKPSALLNTRFQFETNLTKLKTLIKIINIFHLSSENNIQYYFQYYILKGNI